MFLVAPGIAQADHLAVQHEELTVQFVGELLEVAGKATEFARINNGLRHKALLCVIRWFPAEISDPGPLATGHTLIYCNAESSRCK
jgi:hypothetical protein